ncbi:MAG: hypothetical protein VX463_05620 [Pseudomonadota bacterium]|nr:hypothetical protein [Pseudomonadota bacterium]
MFSDPQRVTFPPGGGGERQPSDRGQKRPDPPARPQRQRAAPFAQPRRDPGVPLRVDVEPLRLRPPDQVLADRPVMAHRGGVHDPHRARRREVLPDEIEPLGGRPRLHLRQGGAQDLWRHQRDHQLHEIGAADAGQRVPHGDEMRDLAVGRQRGLRQRQPRLRGQPEQA